MKSIIKISWTNRFVDDYNQITISPGNKLTTSDFTDSYHRWWASSYTDNLLLAKDGRDFLIDALHKNPPKIQLKNAHLGNILRLGKFECPYYITVENCVDSVEFFYADAGIETLLVMSDGDLDSFLI